MHTMAKKQVTWPRKLCPVLSTGLHHQLIDRLGNYATKFCFWAVFFISAVTSGVIESTCERENLKVIQLRGKSGFNLVSKEKWQIFSLFFCPFLSLIDFYVLETYLTKSGRVRKGSEINICLWGNSKYSWRRWGEVKQETAILLLNPVVLCIQQESNSSLIPVSSCPVEILLIIGINEQGTIGEPCFSALEV